MERLIVKGSLHTFVIYDQNIIRLQVALTLLYQGSCLQCSLNSLPYLNFVMIWWYFINTFAHTVVHVHKYAAWTDYYFYCICYINNTLLLHNVTAKSIQRAPSASWIQIWWLHVHLLKAILEKAKLHVQLVSNKQ